MTKKIENIAIIAYTACDRPYAIQWEYNGARYHIWEFHGTKQNPNDTPFATIYKNPPLAPDGRSLSYGNTGYFKTTKLNGAIARNAWMIDEVRRQVKERDLVGQIERNRQATLFAEIAARDVAVKLDNEAVATFKELEWMIDNMLEDITLDRPQVTALLHFYHNHKPAKATDND